MDNKLTNKSDISGNEIKAKSKFIPRVTKQDFLEYKAFQRGVSVMPQWFHRDDVKADEIMSHYNEVLKYYK